MNPKDKKGNAKDPHWKISMDLPSVKPEDYPSDVDSAKGSAAPAGSALRNTDQSGTKGFSPQLAGNGIVGESNTSSFDAGSPNYAQPGYLSEKERADGQKENYKKRHPTTSAAGRILFKDHKD